jgi:hypothetical protein
MPDLWMPGAQNVDVGDHALTDTQYSAKAIAHITWDKNASANAPQDLVSFATLTDYFGRNPDGKAVAPHILWDPFHGTFAQFYPANSRSKSVADKAGGTRTNRAGKVVIQVESLFFPYCRVDGHTYARLADTPCKGWDKLNAWIRSWGVADTWPMGHPVNFNSNRDEGIWETHGGWYAHAQVPENDHQDPGSWPNFISAPASGGGTPAPVYQPFPGTATFVDGHRSPIIEAMHNRLVAVGCGHYTSNLKKDVWGSGDKNSYAAWQRSTAGGGYTGSAADGIPGPASWGRLHVPKVV